MNKPGYLAAILVAFVLGGAGMWTWQHYRLTSIDQQHIAFDNGDPLVSPPSINNLNGQLFQDPFKAMQDMQKQMDRFFNQDDFFSHSGITGNFGSWFSTPQGGIGTKIQKGEDDKTVYYKMKVGKNNLSNVQVNVENGYVSINAELSKKSSHSLAQSSVTESFPVPAGVDPDSAKIDKQGDSIIIHFAKIS